MVSMQDLIGFLWDLMRNDEAKSRFERDPHGTLNDCGLSGVTSRDVQDAQTIMQDRGMAHPRDGWPSSGGHHSPIDEIRHTATYQIDRSTTIDYHNNQQFTVVDIDDRDTLVNDSYNGDTNVVAIQDNDTINHDTDVDVTNIEDSFNDGTAEQPAGDASDEPPVDSPDPATLPAPDPDPNAEPESEADAALDPDPDPDPDHESSSYVSDVEAVDGGGEELDAAAV